MRSSLSSINPYPEIVPPERPLPQQRTGSNNPFLASPIRKASTEYQPGADISSFDASTTRAMPGYRGAHGTTLDCWAQEGESSGIIPATWEDEQNLRRAAERELHRRREIAEKQEMERRLGEEFWKGEEEVFGPLATGKVRSQSVDGGVPVLAIPAVAGGLVGVDDAGHTMNPTPPVSSMPPLPPPLPKKSLEGRHEQSQERRSDQLPQQPVQPSDTPLENQTPQKREQTPPPPQLPPRCSSPEAYQIKHITWIDPVTNRARRSPILLQNANGPCPLLALVNALTLSTPFNTTTVLTEAMRVREYISIGLLLDAVFDGVVTRASTQGMDIDMSDLFAFLMGLSTGMNVNPRFVFPQTPSGDPGPPQLLGSFEQTKEMRLYNSFSVPLYHGWLPAPSSLVYNVLQKTAPTYEEVQNLLLREELILQRISTAQPGKPEAQVSGAEERVVEDAGIIRAWLDDSCTQLTGWGLESLTQHWGGNVHDGKGAGLGQMGILFRNDHFCTVMKGRIPGTHGEVLLSLVTDMGYGGYEEVVWESLVSVNGEGGRFLAGDYRPVGGGDEGVGSSGSRQHVKSMVNIDDNDGWETVGGSRRRESRHPQNQQQQNNPDPQLIASQQPSQPSSSQRRSFVDALLGRPTPQAQLWYQPTVSHPPRGTSSSTSLPNSQIPAPMLPPRTSSRTENTTTTTATSDPPNHTSVQATDTDYDLALAIQLQEEEDERERQQIARQRRHQSAPAPPTVHAQVQPDRPQQQAPLVQRMTPDEQPRSLDGTLREVPPPPYEQHTQDQRPLPHHLGQQTQQQRGSSYVHGTPATEAARYRPQHIVGVGRGGRGFDPEGRRRSEVPRRPQEVRESLYDIAAQRGYVADNGGQQNAGWGPQQGMGPVQGRRNSNGIGDGKKDCLIM